MTTSKVALWYLERTMPLRDRLAGLLADYSPAPGEVTTDIIRRMEPGDRAEATSLAAALLDPMGTRYD